VGRTGVTVELLAGATGARALGVAEAPVPGSALASVGPHKKRIATHVPMTASAISSMPIQVTGRRALAPERVVAWVMWFLLKPLPGNTLCFSKLRQFTAPCAQRLVPHGLITGGGSIGIWHARGKPD